MDVRLRMRVAGTPKGKNFKIVPLQEAMAIDTGADLLGEAFIFSVAAGVVGFEYWRQAANAVKKEEKQDTSLVNLRKDVNRLKAALAEQKSQIEELTSLIELTKDKNVTLVKIDPKNDLQNLHKPIVDRK